MAYQLWHGDGTRSLRVLWLVEELDLRESVDVHPVLFPPRTRQPEYLSVNARGSLPFFVDGDVKMTESVAICHYLVQQQMPTPLAVRPDEAGYGAYLEFSFFGEAALMPPIGTMVRYLVVEPSNPRAADMVEDARVSFRRQQETLVRTLTESQHVAADRFTVADISVHYSLGLAELLGQRDVFAPEVAEYYDRLAARPARVRAYQRQA